MVIQVCGVLVDHLGRILLVQDEESETLSLPGHWLEGGELPEEALAAAFRDESGLIIMPVRLTGITFGSQAGQDRLTLCYRCIMRGGELQRSEEQAPAGFFDAIPLPRPMLQPQRQQTDLAIHHAGGPPVSVRDAIDWRDRLNLRRTDPLPAEEWAAMVVLIATTPDGKVLLQPAEGEGTLRLPETAVAAHEAPWEAAARHITSWELPSRNAPLLRGIYFLPKSNQAVFSYLIKTNDDEAFPGAVAVNGANSSDSTADSSSVLIADALSPTEGIAYRRLDN